MPMPDGLEPGHIPGQNPNTPERMPGHTAPQRATWSLPAPWLLVGVLLAVLGLYFIGTVGH